MKIVRPILSRAAVVLFGLLSREVHAQPASRSVTRPAPGVRPSPTVPPAPTTVSPAVPTQAPSSAPPQPDPPPASEVPQPAAPVQREAAAPTAQAPAAPTQGPRVAVVDAAPIGVDMAAAQFVTGVLRSAIGAAGFQVIPTPELYEAARRIGLPFPVPEDGLLALEQALRAPAGATAEVRAAGGLYVVRLRVRVASERRERVRDVSAGQFQLEDAIRAALPALLVPPSPDGEPPPGTAQPELPRTTASSQTFQGPNGPQESGASLGPSGRRRSVRAHPRAWELGGGVVVAFGPGQDAFVNVLGALRGAWFPHDRIGLSATVAYANLNGREGRVSNVLVMAGLETAVDLVPSARVFIPLRAEVGYLPANGPVFRVTAGIAFQVVRRVRLEVDLLSPTLWVLPESTPVSLDLGAFVSFGL